jgi:UDP-N-acetylglucosamine 1-carboxyvinyltransferase
VQPDHVEIGSLICAAAVTGGDLRVPGVRVEDLRPLERPFSKLGVRWKLQDDGSLLLPAGQTLTVEGDLDQAIPKVEDGVWPNFPSDLMSVLLVLASQARGTALFFEKMFESRMYFVDHLIDMGARLVQCDPHRVIVAGPAPLHGTKLHSPDIRAGMALIVAALCAKGRSSIGNATTVDRGYERIEVKLRALGGEITRKS